ncbi:DUF4236 domain-containing protein [Vibrio sonorensis]|uniref:DUF4236 domain-containing protein n=1 Tax=Vibrio sonorensis TaxID=1004316 RepID=UPI0008D945E0|nr:DUF4236 domain-containing protein [Vibrio sonorensis]
MGFSFRRSVKVLPGVKVNITQKGVSSVSLGAKGSTVNIKKTTNKKVVDNSECVEPESVETSVPEKSQLGGVSLILLWVGIIFIPVIFSWFLLRPKHTVLERVIGFSWLALYVGANSS